MTSHRAFVILVMKFHFVHAKMPKYDANHANGNFLSLRALGLYAKLLYYTA